MAATLLKLHKCWVLLKVAASKIVSFRAKIVEDGSAGKGAYYAKPVWTHTVEGEKRLLQVVFWPLLWHCGTSMPYTDI